MFRFSHRKAGLWVTATLSLSGLIAPVNADTTPPAKDAKALLDEATRLAAISAQQIEASVRQALADTQRVAPSDKDAAVSRLKKVHEELKADTHLLSSRRELLSRLVQTRIRDLENKPATAIASRPNPASQADPEVAAVKAGLTAVESHLAAGQPAEAIRVSEELIRKYPNNPSVQILKRNVALAERVRAAKISLAEADQRQAAAMREVNRASTPAILDMEFPKDWQERTKNRSTTQLSARDRELLRALDKPVPTSFVNTPFHDAIQYLSDLTGQSILLNKADLTEAGVNASTTVNLPIKGVSVRTALRKVLGEAGLAYIIRDGNIQVVSQLKARETLTTRAYYLGDIVAGVGGFGNGVLWGPALSQAQTQENAAAIIEAIVTTVDPTSWKQNGGLGTISFHFPTLSLVVRQTAEVHAMITGSVGK